MVCVEEDSLVYIFQGRRWCSQWAEVVRPHLAAMALRPLERRRLVMHYDLRRATVGHPSSTIGPAPPVRCLPVLPVCREHLSSWSLCDIGICPWKWLSLLGPSDSTSLHFAFRKPWWPTRSKLPVQHPYCLCSDRRNG